MTEASDPTGEGQDLTPGELEILIDGLTDDVAFDLVLIHLGIRGNPPATTNPPTSQDIENAFHSLDRLSRFSLSRVGRIQYIDGGPPGRVAPVEHIEEPLPSVRARVEAACATAQEWGDWAFSCWVVNTPGGDAAAREAVGRTRE